MSLARDFAEQGYAKFSMFGAGYCKFLSDYYWANSHLHERWPDLPGIKRTSVNNLPLMRLLHEASTPMIQSIVGEPIKPSYSFTSAYERGSCLPPHTDQPQCRYNVTLMLGTSHDEYGVSTFWPFFLKHNGQTNQIMLGRGEAVVYSGTQDEHWRGVMPEPFDWVLGVFFHYVPLDYQGSLD